MFATQRAALRFWVLVALLHGFVVGTSFGLVLVLIRGHLSSDAPDGATREPALWAFVVAGGVAALLALVILGGGWWLIAWWTDRQIESAGWQELGGYPTLSKRHPGRRASWSR